MTRSRMLKAGGVAGICAAAGAVAGIAGSAAAPTSHHAQQSNRAGLRGLFQGSGGPLGGARPAGPPVHGQMVVPTQGGFSTITMDRGTFQSLSGNDLTIREGTKTKVYKPAVTLTIPSSAKVMRNFAAASLTDLKSGDTVAVIQSSQGTVVIAFDSQHQPGAGGPRGMGMGGPPGAGGPGFRPGMFGPSGSQAPGSGGGPPFSPPTGSSTN